MIKAAHKNAKAMDLLFMDGKFEQAIEEAINTLVRCVEAINLLAGQPTRDRSESLSNFEENFLGEKKETVLSTSDWISAFTRDNKGLLGRDFEADFKTVHDLALNQNPRVGTASSPKETRAAIIKLSWMSHKLIKYEERLREFISSRETTEETGNQNTK